jgi:hypothetical protein
LAAALKMHECNDVKQLREIEARLLVVEETDDETKITTCVCFSLQELAKRSARAATQQVTGI